MMSDSELAELIDELDEAIDNLNHGKYVPGFLSMLIESKMALKYFREQQQRYSNIGEIKSQLIQSEKNGEQIIPTHLVIAGSEVSACCGKNMFELPLSHRCTLDNDQATCLGVT